MGEEGITPSSAGHPGHLQCPGDAEPGPSESGKGGPVLACSGRGESLVPGARAGSVPTVHQVSLRSGRSLRVVGLVIYALKGIMLLELAGDGDAHCRRRR